MKSNDFVTLAKMIANNYKTIYILGAFGAPMSDKNKSRYQDYESAKHGVIRYQRGQKTF